MRMAIGALSIWTTPATMIANVTKSSTTTSKIIVVGSNSCKDSILPAGYRYRYPFFCEFREIKEFMDLYKFPIIPKFPKFPLTTLFIRLTCRASLCDYRSA